MTVNGKVCSSGTRVGEGDLVRLDGQMQHWQAAAAAKAKGAPSAVLEERDFVYLKYW